MEEMDIIVFVLILTLRVIKELTLKLSGLLGADKGCLQVFQKSFFSWQRSKQNFNDKIKHSSGWWKFLALINLGFSLGFLNTC